MRALLAAAIAAIEAVATALITLLIAAGIAFGVWWFSFDLAAEPQSVLAGAASAWLLAHFVPIAVDIPADAMLQLGFAPEALKFTLSLAPLGLTLLSIIAGARSGWRFGGRGGAGAAGIAGGALGFATATGIVTSLVPLSPTSPWIAALWGALIFGLPSLVAFLVRAAREAPRWWDAAVTGAEQLLARARVPKPSLLLIRVGAVLRLATMLLASYIGIAAIGLTLSLAGRFAQITAASQSLQLDAWGSLILWAVELIFLPVAVLWSGAWLTGAGFAVGIGTSASPFGALLGPLPALPLFSAIPDGWGSLAVLAPTLLVIVGVVIGVLFGSSAVRRGVGELLATSFAAAILFGLVVALLNVLGSGSIGPGRLETTGPAVWMGAGLAALEVGGGALLGALASRADALRQLTKFPELKLKELKLPEMKMPDLKARGLGGSVREERSVLRPGTTEDSVAEGATAEPLAPVASILPRLAERDELAETMPLEDVRMEGKTADDPLPDPHPELGSEVPTPTHRARRAPTLFDQHGASPSDAQQRDAAVSESVREAARTGNIDPVEPDPEALVQAYSWDSIDEGAIPPAAEPKPGWRWPRRKR